MAQSLLTNHLSSSARNEYFKLLRNLKGKLSAEGSGFVAIARKFKAMDLDGNGTIDFEEFTHGLREMDMDMSDEKAYSLFRYFDKVLTHLLFWAVCHPTQTQYYPLYLY